MDLVDFEQDLTAATKAEIHCRDMLRSLGDYARAAQLRASACIDRGDYDGARAATIDERQASHESLKYRAAVLMWSVERRKARSR